jgi:nucleotide-binding universal stress UspA family protein
MGTASIAAREQSDERQWSWPLGSVIVGVDGSWWSELALRWSVWACRRTGRDLEIRHALDRSMDSPSAVVHAARELIHQLNPTLTARCSQLAAPAANVLTDRQRPQDVVTLGWRGATSGSICAPTSIGATVLDVVTRSRGATVVVRFPTLCGSNARVVAAIGRLPDDEPVLRWAAEFAAGPGDELVLAHAVPLAFGERSCQLAEAERAGVALLRRAAEMIGSNRPGPPIRTELARVHPHDLLANPLGADLLVMGNHPATAGEPPGALVRAALHHAPCTVMVTPRTPVR